jgi:MerR family Zn(II)-responsive transcriptional regulator of zntA
MKAMSKGLDRLIGECVDEQKPVEECTILAAFDQAVAH